VVGRIAQDLSAGTGSARGFSRRNLFYMRRFATIWPEREKVQPLAAQIGWTHQEPVRSNWSDPMSCASAIEGPPNPEQIAV
jgi:hypothetical protein